MEITERLAKTPTGKRTKWGELSLRVSLTSNGCKDCVFDNKEGDEFKNAEVYGIKLGKSDSNITTVTMMGERFLQTGGSVDFSSPAQDLESSGGEFEYPYINELNLAVQAVLYEVKEYLFNGKYAIIQKEINFEAVADAPFEAEVGKMVDADTGEVTPIKMDKPRRGRRPKRETMTAVPAC